MRKTKIIGTAGPSSDDPETIEKLIKGGVNVFRLNFSHGDHDYHGRIFKIIRNKSKLLNVAVGILQDLSGPKIRIQDVKKPFILHPGDTVEIWKIKTLGEKIDKVARISIDHPQILDDLKPNDIVCVADGTIRLIVCSNLPEKVVTQVLQGGTISSRKGVNFPGANLSISAFTEKDKIDLIYGLKLGVDFVALSFVNTEEDVIACKKVINDHGSGQPVFAKIETVNGLKNIEKILDVSDGIMIARGDLGVEIPIEKVPVEQKKLIEKARIRNKPVIVATQMLNSMIHSSSPTRADVSDIANAVIDGADALMLSDETAIGNYPVESVQVMSKTIEEAEKVYPYFREILEEESPDYAIAKSSCVLAREIKANAIVVFTKSGSTALRVSRFRPKNLIIGNVHDEEIRRRLTVIWGVYPYAVFSSVYDLESLVRTFLMKASKDRLILGTETLVLTMGYPIGSSGSTNLIRVLKPDQIKDFLKFDTNVDTLVEGI
ncbi:MAG: pyruvate kinase [Deltaproteobacteria bacterium]|nr:pyruvate kinase [Deltaproteobacteria bacterium]